jgi:F-type H+-transporting ATPase subunit b
MASSYWTIALQAVNFLVLVWLLQRLLYRPVLAVIEKRRAMAERALAEAAKVKEMAEEARRSLERERAGFVEERDALMEKAAAEAARECAISLEGARSQAQILELQTRQQMERERALFNETVIAEAAKLAIEIARRLLAASQPTNPIAPFLARVTATLAAMPGTERDRLVLPGETLTLISALPLDEAQRQACTGRISTVLGSRVSISFDDSADLIAGIELRFPRLILRHNWRDDLAAALKDLASHEQSAANA